MTQTLSFRDRLRKGFTVFKWDLRNCSGALLIFAILATVFAAIVLTLSLTFGIANATEEYTQALDFEKLKDAVMAFQLITTYGIFYLNAVFTIIYTIRIYSYLHNKRKADMYGALPIGRRTFFIAKTVSAYLLSVVPTLFFFGIIAVISLCLGQPLLLETAGVFVQLLIGAIASISFYALLSICCGTTVNAVLAFVAVNFAYPIAALFIKGTIRAFFYGMPTNLYNNSFIMKALNPLAAYEGSNILYWLIFTASCLALAVWLVKKRPAECAQNSFAYYLPAYLVKLLVSFIIGMFLGTVFGGLDVFGFPLIGFIFGFTLGSVPAYLIAHIIFYRGLNRFPRTLIAFGAMSAAVFAAIAFCFFDFVGYTAFVPVLQDVKSAGVVELGDCYYTGKTSVWNIAQMAADDYTASPPSCFQTTAMRSPTSSTTGTPLSAIIRNATAFSTATAPLLTTAAWMKSSRPIPITATTARCSTRRRTKSPPSRSATRATMISAPPTARASILRRSRARSARRRRQLTAERSWKRTAGIMTVSTAGCQDISRKRPPIPLVRTMIFTCTSATLSRTWIRAAS